MAHPLGTIQNAATGVITLPTRLAARAYGVARGTVSVARAVVAPAPASPTWEAADPEPAADEPAPVTLGTEPGPVNVVEELDLDPAPVEKPREPATPAVTAIDQQAEPGLVQSTPADVAERIERAQDD